MCLSVHDMYSCFESLYPKAALLFFFMKHAGTGKLRITDSQHILIGLLPFVQLPEGNYPKPASTVH